VHLFVAAHLREGLQVFFFKWVLMCMSGVFVLAFSLLQKPVL
jgi:hypothetical protein